MYMYVMYGITQVAGSEEIRNGDKEEKLFVQVQYNEKIEEESGSGWWASEHA